MRKLLVVSCGLLALTACVEPISQKTNIISGERTDLKVTPPQNCPDWTKMDGNGGNNFGNTQGSNFGCATVTNFGAMVDDPYDMIVGKSTPLTNGTRSAMAVSQYEAGTASSASGSSAASSSTGSAP